MYTKQQVTRIRTISLEATDYETDLFEVLTQYDDVVQRDPITGAALVDGNGVELVYEVPEQAKKYVPTIRKIATRTEAGLVKVGDNMNITGDGKIEFDQSSVLNIINSNDLLDTDYLVMYDRSELTRKFVGIGTMLDKLTQASGVPTGTNASVGGGNSHNNLQPYMTVNYIIKT